ncbi:Ig-like domain-containing protein, partial [Bradyrhizobium sp. LMTR 3]|uniref:Ig-like domain-containing protein n=1 Tax=Bradyrhizobium sp. LMTR 3 TaxID=189873 RepID=UPI00081056CF
SAPPATPATPTIASFSNDTGAAGDGITSDNTLQLKGTAAANSTIKIYDGSTQIGTTTASSTGSWDYITSVLTNAKHVLTATATNSSGQVSAASGAMTVTVDTVAPTAPVLSSNAIVNTNQVKLSGTAEANSTVTVYEGTTVVGTGTTNSTGAWSVTTNALSTGTHALTAKAADVAGNVSAASQSVSSAISGTSPSPTPGEQVVESAGTTSLVESGGKYYLNSSSGSGPTLKYGGADFVDGQDGTWTPIGAEKTATGYQVAWKEASTGQYTAWNTDNNGNYVSHVSALTGSASGGAVSGTNYGLKLLETSFHQDLNSDGQIGTSSAPAPTSSVDLTTMYKNWSDIVTIKGVADANSQIKLYDGNASLGTVNTAADGSWSFKTSSAVSDTVHTYTAKQIDSTGQVVGTSGNAILGSTGSNTLTSTSGDDLFVGNGGADTFVFAPNFGNDVVKDFGTYGRSHDVVQFSKSVFDSFASVLAHATQVGQDVVISADADNSVTLKNTKLGAINSHDFHFS